MAADEFERNLYRHQKLMPLLELWMRKRRNRAMPARSDIDTIDLRDWLGNLILVETVEGDPRYRYRVFGTKLVELFGYELTGKPVSNFASTRQPLIAGDYERVRRDKRPVYFDRPGVAKGEYARLHILALPLSADGTDVDMILAAVYGAGSNPTGRPRPGGADPR